MSPGRHIIDAGKSPQNYLRSARRTAPPIPGLYFDPTVGIPMTVASKLWDDCMQTFFHEKSVNQVMLFERAREPAPAFKTDNIDGNGTMHLGSRLPAFLLDLLGTLETLLRPCLPPNIFSLLFPGETRQARQVILNHYKRGEGITPHIDLLNRYGDGIMGISLNSGCAMRFAKVAPKAGKYMVNLSNGTATESTEQLEATRYEGQRFPDEPNLTDLSLTNGTKSNTEDIEYLYLPVGSILILTGEARYNWTHGIEDVKLDLIESEGGGSAKWIERDERISITYRWMLPDADILKKQD